MFIELFIFVTVVVIAQVLQQFSSFYNVLKQCKTHIMSHNHIVQLINRFLIMYLEFDLEYLDRIKMGRIFELFLYHCLLVFKKYFKNNNI